MGSKRKDFKLQNILGGIAIAVVVVLMYFWLIPDADWQGLKVATGEKDSVQFSDGSMAYLVGPAQIGYPKFFDDKARGVKIDGEIYFEVVNDSNKNFLVQTEKGGIETRASKFVVNTCKKKNITVHCLEGTLRMIVKGKREILEIDLGENQMSNFTKGDRVIEKKIIDSIQMAKTKRMY